MGFIECYPLSSLRDDVHTPAILPHNPLYIDPNIIGAPDTSDILMGVFRHYLCM